MRKGFITTAILISCAFASVPASVAKAGTTDDEKKIIEALVKGGAIIIAHESSKPAKGDGVLENLAKGLAREFRDELIDDLLKDLDPQMKAVERAAVLNLVILALDGKLPPNREKVLADLKRIDKDGA